MMDVIDDLALTVSTWKTSSRLSPNSSTLWTKTSTNSNSMSMTTSATTKTTMSMKSSALLAAKPFILTGKIFDAGFAECPACGEKLEFDLDGCDCGCDDCGCDDEDDKD